MNSNEPLVLPKSEYYLHTPGVLARSLFLYPTMVGTFFYKAGYHLRRKSFDSFLCFLVTEGSCTVESGGKSFTASKGQIVLLDCYAPHAYGADHPWACRWVHFDGLQARGFYGAITREEGNCITLPSPERFAQYLSDLCAAFTDPALRNDARFNNLLITMMTELLTCADHVGSPTQRGDVIDDAITYLIDHLDTPLSLAELAAHAHLSPFYFARLFKQKTGYSPHDYMLTTRIRHAGYLLSTTDMSNKDICYQLGFSCESAFCTAFKKKTGQSPGEFRKQQRAQPDS